MSAIKPVIRELKQAVLKGAAHSKDKLHQVADRLTEHVDTVARAVRDKDRFDDAPSTSTRRPDVHTPNDRMEPRPECLGPDGRIDWDTHAPHNGFVLDADGNPITQRHVPAAGDRFDRYGEPNGRFVSPIPEDGPFDYDSRSMPYRENPNAYHQYEWNHSPADVRAVYDGLDEPIRTDLDDAMDKYGLTLDDLTSVARGEAAAIPAWNLPGGATQDVLPLSVELLHTMGMIKEL